MIVQPVMLGVHMEEHYSSILHAPCVPCGTSRMPQLTAYASLSYFCTLFLGTFPTFHRPTSFRVLQGPSGSFRAIQRLQKFRCVDPQKHARGTPISRSRTTPLKRTLHSRCCFLDGRRASERVMLLSCTELFFPSSYPARWRPLTG